MTTVIIYAWLFVVHNFMYLLSQQKWTYGGSIHAGKTANEKVACHGNGLTFILKDHKVGL